MRLTLRPLLLLVTLSLLISGPSDGARLGDAQQGLLIGLLEKQGIRSCDKKGNVSWLKQHHEVGFVWLLPFYQSCTFRRSNEAPGV